MKVRGAGAAGGICVSFASLLAKLANAGFAEMVVRWWARDVLSSAGLLLCCWTLVDPSWNYGSNYLFPFSGFFGTTFQKGRNKQLMSSPAKRKRLQASPPSPQSQLASQCRQLCQQLPPPTFSRRKKALSISSSRLLTHHPTFENMQPPLNFCVRGQNPNWSMLLL